MRWLGIATLIAGCAASMSAAADEIKFTDSDYKHSVDRHTGRYVSLSGGINLADDALYGNIIRYLITDFELAPDWDMDPESGFTAVTAVGRRISRNFRAEVEAGYRRKGNELREMTDPDMGSREFDGAVSTLSLMLNCYYDFRNIGAFRPYAGVGAGGTRATVQLEETEGGGQVLDDSAWAFSYQGIVGVSVPLANTPLEIYADYRYMRTHGLDFEFSSGGNPYRDEEYTSQAVTGGIRFHF